MNAFEKEMLDTACLKPTFRKQFVDDTLLIWPHGQEALTDFVRFLNSCYNQIKFTMELKQDRKLPFLDMQQIMHPDGQLGRTIYQKPAHTNLHMKSHSRHHPAPKGLFMSTLLNRAKGIMDADHLIEEQTFLKEVFLCNGFTRSEVECTISNHGKWKPGPPEEETIKSVTVIPLLQHNNKLPL